MDLGNIPAVASALASQQTSDSVNIAMLKKALDSQTAAAVGILQALPQPANPNVGRNVNTVA
ncbi:YjfB family protein [Herbaspirillum sp. RV1423]|uniref:YjfB family protein n=1 Tax=Herbaspirillum sp. RV1423 TaxID=1443993 RepID=UPI0004ADD5A6|nr:YjfB family protein [Herbaspirillum sp. RV1423]